MTLRALLRTNSLSFRLIAGAAIWSVLGLIVGGLVLSSIFRNSVQSSFDKGLVFDLESLVAAAETDAPRHVTFAGRFTRTRFERIYSGWYWQVSAVREDGSLERPQISRSLWDHVIAPADVVEQENMAWGFANGPDDQNLRILMRRVELPVPSEDDPAQTRAFRFLVAGDLAETEENVARFNIILFWSLMALGAGLITAVMIQVRVGLVPLRRFSEALGRIREGRARQLEGDFPDEIAPLASELNGLIAHSAEVVGRARTHVANLAHFLKTPLTVIANEASTSQGPLAQAVLRQVTVMRRQVDHYLARARAAGALNVLGSRTEVSPVLGDLARVLKRMHPDKQLEIVVQTESELVFRGEREDLEEMVGNLIDNACKWAGSHVTVHAAAGESGRLVISVEDDGPGLPEKARARAMERGKKLDETVPGSGLGLAIVRDIAKLYTGSLHLDRSELGGLKAQLDLPGAQ